MVAIAASALVPVVRHVTISAMNARLAAKYHSDLMSEAITPLE